MSATAIDPGSGLHILQNRVGFRRARVGGTGHITYRCFTCGEMIPRPWEVFFVDLSPRNMWASSLVPGRTRPTLTTHHDWHMASQQRED